MIVPGSRAPGRSQFATRRRPPVTSESRSRPSGHSGGARGWKSGGVHISVLGPLDVRDDDGGSVTIGGARLRALLIRLALEPGRPVSAERLIEAVWGEEPPSGAANAL